MLRTEQLLREAGKERRPSWLSPLAARGRPSVRPIPVPLRGCPAKLCGSTKVSQHEAKGCETEEGQGLTIQVLPILGQPASAVHPGDGSFDDPTAGEHHKTFF